MRAVLWRLVGTVLIVLGVFAGGIGVYAAARALWPLLVVWWPWLLAGMAAVAALSAWWLWWRLPKRQMRSITAADPKARADIEDNFRKTIGQLLGGAAVLIGAALAYLQFTQQQQTSQQQFLLQQQRAQQQFLQRSKYHRSSSSMISSRKVLNSSDRPANLPWRWTAGH